MVFNIHVPIIPIPRYFCYRKYNVLNCHLNIKASQFQESGMWFEVVEAEHIPGSYDIEWESGGKDFKSVDLGFGMYSPSLPPSLSELVDEEDPRVSPKQDLWRHINNLHPAVLTWEL